MLGWANLQFRPLVVTKILEYISYFAKETIPCMNKLRTKLLLWCSQTVLLLCGLGLFFAQTARATTAVAADGGVVWCNGSEIDPTTASPYGTVPYPYTLYTEPVTGVAYPDVLTPDGLAANPANTWDTWRANPILTNGKFGDIAETAAPASPLDPLDRYAIQLDYWNSVVMGQSGALGYSTGNSCVLLYYNTGNIGQFTITYPANPSQPNANETILASTNPALFQAFPLNNNSPYSGGTTGIANGTASPTDGGPTGYVSTFKGCSWDANSCTAGSAVLTASNPTPTSTDWNSFPQLLSNITSIPTTWNIEFNHNYGYPESTDGSHIWDASYDIWFDKTGQTGTGQAPYGNARGQNDGLEIMVWMNSEHSYVDVPGAPTPNTAGYAQPSGWPREQVLINNVVYDVWSSRLNNPSYGYTSGKIIAQGAEPYNCQTLPLYNPNTGSAATPATNVTNANGTTCGTEWNVVSFVATKYNGTDYRKTSMAMDTKVFTDYILGIPDGLWQTVSAPTAGDRVDIGIASANGVLACPASAMSSQQANPPTNPSACLSDSWFLTSVQAGFEPWMGGNGLQSDSFVAHVNTHSTAVQTGNITATGQPVVFWGSPFDVVYSGCASNTSPNTASFTITGYYNPNAGTSTATPVTWPANGIPVNMTAMPGSPNLFEYTVPALSPMHGTATINFISSCGNYTVSIFIDPSGRVFYSDGKTPAPGATVTLLNSSSGSAGGPFESVPNHNYGLTAAVMAPDGNTLNPMPSSQYGSYGWDVAPGYYEVNAALDHCGSVTSPVQQVVNTPITNLFLNLPCAAPQPVAVERASIPSEPTSLTAAVASSAQINLSWNSVPMPLNATSVTYSVVEVAPVSAVIASGITATSYIVTGLNPNTSYSFEVEAVDAGGVSPVSSATSATTQQAPAGACHVTYNVQSATPGVNNGLTVSFNIQNTGSTALYPWTLSWSFPGNQTISYAWNATETQSGASASLTSSAAWESIPAGGTLYSAVGFNGSYTGTNAIPSAFYINGALCQ